MAEGRLMPGRGKDPAARARKARLAMESFDIFFTTYWPCLVHFLKTQANSSRFAEDVASEAMIVAADKWDDLLTYDRPDLWLFKVAIRMLRRSEARARRDGLLYEDADAFSEDLQGEVLRDDWVNDHMDLVAAVRSLRRRQCEVIGLHYLCDYSIPETARMLDMKVGTVKAHLHGGLVALRRHYGVVSVPQEAQGRIPA
jgi:RNA polymerase sigma-70 factor (ECF subfamily)